MKQTRRGAGTEPSDSRAVAEEQYGQLCANKLHNLDYVGKCL